MFGEDYYAELDSVPRRWSQQLTRHWLRVAAFVIPVVVTAFVALLLGVSGFVAGVAAALYAVAIKLFRARIFPDFSGHIGFLCGYLECGRLISPLFYWECPYCDHIPKHLDYNGKGSYFRECKACGRKPYTIACPHCERPLPLVRPEHMPLHQPRPARVFRPGNEPFNIASIPAETSPVPPPQSNTVSAWSEDDLADISRRLDQ